jgi:hypothetical protein
VCPFLIQGNISTIPQVAEGRMRAGDKEWSVADKTEKPKKFRWQDARVEERAQFAAALDDETLRKEVLNDKF